MLQSLYGSTFSALPCLSLSVPRSAAGRLHLLQLFLTELFLCSLKQLALFKANMCLQQLAKSLQLFVASHLPRPKEGPQLCVLALQTFHQLCFSSGSERFSQRFLFNLEMRLQHVTEMQSHFRPYMLCRFTLIGCMHGPFGQHKSLMMVIGKRLQ